MYSSGKMEFNRDLEMEKFMIFKASIRLTLTDPQVPGTIHLKKVSKGQSFFGFKSKTASPQILGLKDQSFVIDALFE